MKNKGFTLVELITTFALSSIIIFLLLNIIIQIKNIYSKTEIKTELYIDQANLSNALNKKLNDENIVSYTSSYTEHQDGTFENIFSFNLVDGEKILLEVTNKKIKVSNYIYELPDNTEVLEATIEKYTVPNFDEFINDAFLLLKIPIKCSLYPNIDFGINLVYPYNTSKIDL